MVDAHIDLERPARYEYVAGLRALAAVAILAYEAAKHAPAWQLPNVWAHRAPFAGVHGVELFFTLSAFVLAAPLLAEFRKGRCVSLDLGRFALRRALRILPAACAVLAITFLLPYALARYGIVPGPARVAWGDTPGNDAFVGLGLQLRAFAAFPILIVLYALRPGFFAIAVVCAIVGDLFTPAHSLDLGALTAFALGIVAADVRVRSAAFQRFALPLALVTGAGAFLSDPFIATLPGPRDGSTLELWNPLWAVAMFSLVVAAGGPNIVRRALASRPLAWLGAASFAIALVAEPVITFILGTATPTLGITTAALNAIAVAIVAGVILWRALDRLFFPGGAWLEQASLELIPPARRIFAALHIATLRFAPAPPPSERRAASNAAYTMERPAAGTLPSVVERIGSLDDLHAEIRAVQQRFEAEAAYHAQRNFMEPPRLQLISVESIPNSLRTDSTEPRLVAHIDRAENESAVHSSDDDLVSRALAASYDAPYRAPHDDDAQPQSDSESHEANLRLPAGPAWGYVDL